MTTRIPTRAVALAASALLAVAACSSGATTPPGSQGAAASGAASGGGAPNCVTGSITASGSTALQPLVDAAGKAYARACSGSTINVQGGGSGTGLSQVLQGAVQLGDSDVSAASKLATPDANSLVDHVIARQGWVMVTNTSVTGVTNLTTDQAKAIWTGQVTNWNQVGGPNQPIVLIIRPQSSGTRQTFRNIVLGGAAEASGQAVTEDSNGAVTTAVQQTPGSTSVIGFAYYQANKANLNALQLDGVQATVANMTTGTYKLQAFGHMYTKGQPDGLTKAFIDYVLGDYVQHALIPTLFYAPAQ